MPRTMAACFMEDIAMSVQPAFRLSLCGAAAALLLLASCDGSPQSNAFPMAELPRFDQPPPKQPLFGGSLKSALCQKDSKQKRSTPPSLELKCENGKLKYESEGVVAFAMRWAVLCFICFAVSCS